MRVRSALALLWVWLFAGCPAELKELNATEVVVRIDAAPDVLSALTSLRVRIAREQDGQWVERSARTFERADLRWPVDIVVVPRSEAEGELDFEIVIDALTDAGAPLVQQRALTSFVRRETRILRVLLARCGDQALGFVCDDDAACLGPTCQTCVDDRCQSVPRSAPESLAPFVPPPEMPVDLDAGDAPDDVQVQVEPDDAQVQVEPDAAQVQVEPDAAVDADSAQVVVCERGTRADDAGGCVDVDECTEQLDDCDDAPEACVNLLGAAGYQCTCPGGYEGTGSGATGCLDIDECMTGAAQCGTLVPCSNVDGSYKCGDCPAGYRENASGDCEDVNECSSANGGCDTMPMATCHNQTGAANTCSCPAGYTGDGRGSAGCVDINECSVNNGGCDRDPMADCHNQTGAANTCSCPAGFSGDGRGSAGCVDINECSVNNGGCDRDPMADCHNQTGAANTCSCRAGSTGDGRVCTPCATGFSGPGCLTDVCNPNPCQTGYSCTRTVAGASCRPNCATTPSRCAAGQSCATTSDCGSGLTCDNTDRTCLQTCGGPLTITSRDSLANIRFCREIHGDLRFEQDFPQVLAADLPYLMRVTGTLSDAFYSPFTRLELAALRSVGGLILGAIEPYPGASASGFSVLLPALTQAGEVDLRVFWLTRVEMPVLSQVSGDLGIGSTHIDLRALTTVGGNVSFTGSYLTSLNISALNHVAGDFSATYLSRLPYSSVSRMNDTATGLNRVDGSVSIREIGCCLTSLSSQFACTADSRCAQ